MLTPQAIQGIQFVFNVSFFFFRIELGTKTHGFRYFLVFLGNAVKAYCDWVVNFRTSLIEEILDKVKLPFMAWSGLNPDTPTFLMNKRKA
jgi:hypothetical protein